MSMKDIMAYWQSCKPLIKEGYAVLGKTEVIMNMPGPCFPPKNVNEDAGIGSPYGEGAKRVADFFDGVVHKIQLGPSGKTFAEFYDSPYMSDVKHNPFFIPLEYLRAQGLISEHTLRKIYDLPKASVSTDYAQVRHDFDIALTEAYKNSRSKLVREDYIERLALSFMRNTPLPFIGDLQVQIPPCVYKQDPDLFLKGFTLGSPPDMFSKSGQNWGLAYFDPAKLFTPKGALGPAGKAWMDVISKAMAGNKGGLRIDHYIGFVNPYMCSKVPNVPNARLFSSPDHPVFKDYVKHSTEQFADITEKILIACAKKHRISPQDLYIEDVGARPEQLDPVMKRCGFGRLLVTQFVEINDPNHIYQLMRAQPHDVAALDTHDTQSLQAYFAHMDGNTRYMHAKQMSDELRFNYNDDLKSNEQLLRMKWGQLMLCPAQRVHAFFTTFTGQVGRYNTPENYQNSWKLRCVPDFQRLYFTNLTRGWSYNPFDAIALAIYARGDHFYRNHEALVHGLRAAEENIVNLARNLG